MIQGQPGSVVRTLRQTLVRQDGAGMPDAALLDDFIIRQDEAAFTALVQRHGLMVLGVCRRVLHNHADAEDAFQATFLVLARKAAALDRRGTLANWLYGVAYRTAVKARAMNSRRQVREQRAGRRPQTANHEEFPPELYALLDAELNQLPEKYRTPIVLCELQGKPLKEAAQLLGCPPGTVASRLARGRTMLAHRLKRHGGCLTIGALTTTFAQQNATAAVPLPLLLATVKVASSGAAGSAVLAGVISAKVAALTEEVMKALLLTRLKSVIGMVLIAVTLTGTVAIQTLPARTHGTDLAPPQESAPGGKTEVPAPLYKEKLFLRPQRDPGDQIFLAVLSPDGKVLVCGLSSGCKILETATGRELATINQPVLQAAAVSPSGNVLATGNFNSIRLWDATTGKALAVVAEGTKNVARITFSPDGKQIATAEADGLRLWDTATGREIHRLPAGKAAERVVSGVAFSPDGKVIASAEGPERTVKIWDVVTGREQTALAGHKAGILDVAISPDGKRLASAGSDGQVKLWDLATKGEKETLKWQTNGRHSLAFSPDGRILATTGRDTNDVMLWDVQTGKDLQVLKHTRQVWSVMFSRDGRILVTAGDDGIRIWEAVAK